MSNKFEEVIKPLMSEKRYKHCINVSKSAQELAEKYKVDAKKAKVAGILHDITKERTPDEHWGMIKSFNIPISEFERYSIKLLHSKTGSSYIENILGIDDGDIINAVKYHTTGRAGMSKFEKVLFLADFISDERNYSGVDEIRKAAKDSLDKGVFAGLSFTISSLLKDKHPIHSDTIAAYNEAAFRREKEII